LVAAETLNSELYQWSAVDGYFALNAKFWNSENGFYANKDQVLTRQDLIDLALVLEKIKPHLEGQSLEQLKQIEQAVLQRLSLVN
jgi:hypothetical protein